MPREPSLASQLPHDGVRVRLGVSDIHGVGVFALAPIAKGTNVFARDQRPLTWVDAAELEGVEPFERAFYEDFAIRRGGRFGCPESFDQLSVGWYVNETREGEMPNLAPTPEDELIAARDIAAGEELTVDYAAFGR